MSEGVLVAYASKYGSTQEVADRVGATLRSAGHQVDLAPVREVESVAGYRAAVLGSPLYIGRFLKDMKRFLSRHGAAVADHPVAFFALGPTRQDEPWDDVRRQLGQELAKYPSLAPAVVELFGGAYDPTKLRFPDSLLTKPSASPLHGLPASDLRDWAAIDAWAKSLPEILQLGSAD